MSGTWPYTKLAPAGAFCPKINTLRYNVACQRVVRWPMRDNHFLLDPSQYLLLFPSYSRWSAGDRFFFWKSSPGPTVGLRLSLTTQRFLIAFWLLYNNIFSHSPSGHFDCSCSQKAITASTQIKWHRNPVQFTPWDDKNRLVDKKEIIHLVNLTTITGLRIFEPSFLSLAMSSNSMTIEPASEEIFKFDVSFFTWIIIHVIKTVHLLLE